MPTRNTPIFIERLCHFKPGICLDIHRWGASLTDLALAAPRTESLMAIAQRGIFDVKILGHRLELMPGDCLVLPGGIQALVTPRSSAQAVMIVSIPLSPTQYRPPEFGKTFRAIIGQYSQIIKNSPNEKKYFLARGFDEFVSPVTATNARLGQKKWMLVNLSSLLLSLINKLSHSDQNTPDNQQISFKEKLPQIEALLQENPAQPPSLAELSKITGLSASFISREFTRCKGISLRQYLQEIRIDAAATMLKSGKSNVSEAAHAVGYESLAQFTRAFSKIKGCSPKDFKRSQQRAKGIF